MSWGGYAGVFDWVGGVRGEWTLTGGQQRSQQVSTAYRYLRLYPSLHVNDHLSDQSTLSLAASWRVTRPAASNFNPYIDYEYTPNLRSGNANLRPQYTQSYETGYDYQGHTLNFSMIGYYRRNSDSVTDVIESLGNGLSLSTKANLQRNDSSGLEFTSSGHLLFTLGYGVSGNLFYSQIDTSALGTPGLRSTIGLNGKVKLDYRPVAGVSAQIVVSRTDKVLTSQGAMSAPSTSSISAIGSTCGTT